MNIQKIPTFRVFSLFSFLKVPLKDFWGLDIFRFLLGMDRIVGVSTKEKEVFLCTI